MSFAAPRPFRVAESLGPTFSAVVDLTSPDDRDTGRFQTELGELFALFFEPWRPAGAGAGEPFVDADTLAAQLAGGWAEVWFPHAGRPGEVAPLISHPWMRVLSEHRPYEAQDRAGQDVQLASLPPDDSPSPGPHCWVRAIQSPVELVELRVRPDRARAGRVRAEVKLNTDLAHCAPDPAPMWPGAVEMAFVLAGYWEDFAVLFEPTHHEVREGTGPLAAGALQHALGSPDLGCRVAARLEERLLQVREYPTAPGAARSERVVLHWIERLARRFGPTPAIANALRTAGR
jgi:hypothetical protein